MNSFWRSLFRRNPSRITRVLYKRTMSTAQTSAILYAATVATPSLSSARPEDEATKNKKHHVGKHFDNPWDSWRLASSLEARINRVTDNWISTD
jgi:hypothetical protein